MRISFLKEWFHSIGINAIICSVQGDNLPLATAASGTNGSIQVSEHGVDTSNEIHSNVSRCSRKRMPVPDSCTSHSTRMTPEILQGSWFAWANTLFGELLWKTFNDWNTNHLINQCK